MNIERCVKVKILKLRRTGKGFFVRIPNEVVEKLHLESKEKVEVYVDYDNGLIIYKPF
jgi:antitoxin component of MazEF toxin-antitoxin module